MTQRVVFCTVNVTRVDTKSRHMARGKKIPDEYLVAMGTVYYPWFAVIQGGWFLSFWFLSFCFNFLSVIYDIFWCVWHQRIISILVEYHVLNLQYQVLMGVVLLVGRFGWVWL